jgi:hypothetical protein
MGIHYPAGQDYPDSTLTSWTSGNGAGILESPEAFTKAPDVIKHHPGSSLIYSYEGLRNDVCMAEKASFIPYQKSVIRISWWAECCLHARDKSSIEGEYIDQPILNLMPIYYEGVHVLKHKGCNLGVWNRGECPRVRQTDGNIQIDGQYPVVFIHFNGGIDPRTDYMLGAYYHQYLDTLKRYSETLWKREINQRKSGQDTYQENLPPWCRQLKKVFIRVLSAITFFRRKKQIVLLAHPGTSLQCLGLWLRTIPGTVVSGMPVKDWSDDPVDDMHHDMERITETPEALKRFQRSILNGERCDETRMR